jgi:sigma-B regulation protein RsbU (phosphoserine phosphatase)
MTIERLSIAVTGVAQGAEFRPFVHTLAVGLGLAGFVTNRGGEVIVEAEGPAEALAAFVAALRVGHPLATSRIPPRGDQRFVNQPSAEDSLLEATAPEIALLLDETVRTAKIQGELEIAKRVQTSILPRDLTLEGYQIAAVMVPAEDVGGDYYDLHVTPATAFLGIGDVSGHGLDAGLVMLMVQSAMSAIVRTRPDGSPRDMLEALNEVLYENIRKRLAHRDHVTMTLFRLDPDGRIVFSGAHEDVLLRRASTGVIERIRTPGVWLGAKRDIRSVMVDTTLRLEDGDLMVLYTDGITEARDAAGKMFDIDGLVAAVQEAADRSVEDIRDFVLARAQAHLVKQDDDMSLVVVCRQRKGPG